MCQITKQLLADILIGDFNEENSHDKRQLNVENLDDQPKEACAKRAT